MARFIVGVLALVLILGVFGGVLLQAGLDGLNLSGCLFIVFLVGGGAIGAWIVREPR